MNCPVCKSTISDDALVCQDCGTEVAKKLQLEKRDRAKQKIDDAIHSSHRSVLTLICAILLIINCVVQLVVGFTSIFTLPVTLITVITSIISIVAIFKLRSKDPIDTSKMKSVTSYLNWLYISSCITVAVVMILAILIVIACVAGASALEEIGGGISDLVGSLGGDVDPSFDETLNGLVGTGGGTLIIIGVVISGIMISVSLWITNVYYKAKNYYAIDLVSFVSGKTNTIAKPSVIGLYIIGGLNVITLTNAGVGIYLILLGVWYRSMYKSIVKEKAAYDEECRKLTEIEAKTAEYNARLEKERRQLQIEEDRRRQEKERQEKDKNDQQQMMMQQMMMQMMANMQQNQNNQNNSAEKKDSDEAKPE